jgi:ribosomal protein L23
MSEQAQTFASADALFALDLDDLADLASFETPAPGSYILTVSMDTKKINQKDAVEASFEVVEVVELKNKDDKAVVPGTKFSTAFFIDNEFGVGNLKKFLVPFAAHFGNTNIGALIRDDMKNVTIACIVKNRKDKTDPEKVYASVDNISVA